MILRPLPSPRGPLRAVILDWAGTVVDCGSQAPAGVFVEVFRRHGVALSPARAREPMGMHKRQHLERVCAMPEVAAGWAAVHGGAITAAQLDALFAELSAAQIAVLEAHADPIPGVLDALAALRAQGLGIGSTTGYTAEMLAVLRPAAAARGYVPDCAISSSDVPEGRPAPYMNWAAATALRAWPASCVAAVGDTPTDIAAALNAGMIAVGVVLTGNEVGLDAAALAALDPTQRAALRERAAARLREAGAHLLIDSVAELPQALAALG